MRRVLSHDSKDGDRTETPISGKLIAMNRNEAGWVGGVPATIDHAEAALKDSD